MRRFATAAVATAAHRTFVTSAILRASHASDVVSVDTAEKNGASNCEALNNLSGFFTHVTEAMNGQEREKIEELRKECDALRERCELLRRIAAVRNKHLFIVAKALQKVDQQFQRRFDTDPLLVIWCSPPFRCEEAANQALQTFLEENEQWLPKPLQVQFFSAWQGIHQWHFSFPQKRDEEVKLQPHPDELKAAVDTCCGHMGNDVCAALFGVMSHSGGVE